MDFRNFPRPRVVISRCIEFENVRWNAQIVRSDLVKALADYVNYITVCPEVDIGLGVPRKTLRLVQIDGEVRLVQPDTNLDVTDRMHEFAKEFLGSLPEVDGFIMKSGSPTSGLGRVKLYPGLGKVAPVARRAGFFGGMVKEKFSNLALEEEQRLKNSRIKEHFLRKLFTIAGFREMKESKNASELVRFHTENKLTLKAYNQKEARILGRIVANPEKKPFDTLVDDYAFHLYSALDKAPRCTSYVNVLMNSIGYFKDKLSRDEKEFFLELLERYRQGRTPLIAPLDVMRSWIVRFEEEYLVRQTFFEPYPEGLIDVDSIVEACGSRDYWKE